MQTVKFSTNLALLHSKITLNTTSLANVATPYANWTLMSLATFLFAMPHLDSQTSVWFLNPEDTLTC